MFQRRHLDAWGHTLSVLLESLPGDAPPSAELVDRAKELDKHYIPTRYPNGFERGAPVDFYTRREAEQAIANAEAILEWCRRQIEEIVVFGSFAEGRWAPGSDLDVFIVLSHSPKPIRDRIPDLLPGAFPVGVDLFPFTREEVAARTPSSLLDAVGRSRWRYARGGGSLPA